MRRPRVPLAGARSRRGGDRRDLRRAGGARRSRSRSSGVRRAQWRRAGADDQRGGLPRGGRRQPLLPGPGRERPALRDLSPARGEHDGHSGGDSRPLRGERGHRSDLQDERWFELSARRRRHGGCPARGVQHAAHQGAHPRRPGGSRHRRVRADGRGRSLRLRRPQRQRRRALALSPSAAHHQPAVPEHGDVGWPRDAPEGIARGASLRPRRTRRTARPRDTPQAPVPLTEETRQQIVAYEMGLFTAQILDCGGRAAARAQRLRRPRDAGRAPRSSSA